MTEFGISDHTAIWNTSGFQYSFDRVPHDILVNKVVRCGLDESAFVWIHGWQADRTEQLLVNSFLIDLEEGDKLGNSKISLYPSIVQYFFK